jgi:hypothetical protein
MEAISGRRTIQEIAADHTIELRHAVHLTGRPDPGKPVEAAAAGWRQRAVPADGAAADGAGAGVVQKSLSCSDAHELRKLVSHDYPELSSVSN